MESNDVQVKQKAPALGNATGGRNTARDTHSHLQLCLHHGTRGLTPQPHQSSDPAWQWVFPAFRVQWPDTGPLRSPRLSVRSPSLPWFVPAASPGAECLPGPAAGSGLHPSPSPLTFSSSLYSGLMVLRLMVVLRFPCRDLSGRR